MKIIVDKIDVAPPHALTLQELRALLSVVPKEWEIWLRIVHMKATLPENSRFARPVLYSFPRLNICCRGLSADQARREILRELAARGLRISPYYGNQLSEAQLKHIDEVIAPLLKKAKVDAAVERIDLGAR